MIDVGSCSRDTSVVQKKRRGRSQLVEAGAQPLLPLRPDLPSGGALRFVGQSKQQPANDGVRLANPLLS
jgi:hypothetical protein